MGEIKMKNLDVRRNNYKKVGKYAIYKEGTMPLNNVRMIDTTKEFGTMTTKDIFYDSKLDYEKRKAIFLERRKVASLSHNGEFDPYKFYMPSQTKDGSATVLTQEMVDAYQDGWDLDIKSDILIVTDKTPGVVAGYPVADCPVLIASDLKNGVTATAHCGAEMVDRYLPQKTVEALQSKYDSKLDDIRIYIGSHAGANWTYDRVPSFINESFWEETGAFRQVGDKDYKIDLRKALLYQLNPEKFESYIVNNDDTITNNNYFSNSAAGKDESKFGRQFTGAYYKKR